MKNPLTYAIVSLLVFFTTGCLSRNSGAEATRCVQLTKTAGHDGRHPYYQAALYPDGRIVYEGIANVSRKGRVRIKTSEKVFETLWEKIETSDIWSLEDRYSSALRLAEDGSVVRRIAYGMPEKRIEVISKEKGAKKIIYSYGAPSELEELERMIDSILESELGIIQKMPR